MTTSIDKRIELDAAADPACLLGGDEGRAGTKERVDDDIAAMGEGEERVLEHRGRLDCRMASAAESAFVAGDAARLRGGFLSGLWLRLA